MKKIYTLLLASIIVTSIQSQSIDLSLKLEKGKEYRQVTTSKSTVEQNMMGQEINMTMTSNGAMTYNVENINEDIYEMKAMYNELNMSMEMPQGTVKYSSETKDTADGVSSLFSDIKNKPFELEINKKGRVKEVRNIDALWQTVIDSSDDLSEEQKEQMKSQIKAAFGEETIKSNMELASAIYPDKPVKKGDKWTINTNIEGDIKLKVSTEYELVDFTSEYALIKGNAIIEPNNFDENNAKSMMPMPMKFDLSGNKTSEIKVDINTGWIIEAKTTQEIEGEIEMQMGGSQEENEGVKISMKMVQETLVTN